MNARVFAAAMFFLWTAAAHAAVSVTLDCDLPHNDDGRIRNVFALDPDEKTVRDHYVDFNGNDYEYQSDLTYPAIFSGSDVAWKIKTRSGTTAFMLHDESGKWTVTVSDPDLPDLQRAACTVSQKLVPGDETQ